MTDARVQAIATAAYAAHAASRGLGWAPGSAFGEGGAWSAGAEYGKVFDGSVDTFWDSSGDVNGVNFAAAALEASPGGGGWHIARLRWHPRNGFFSRNVGAQLQVQEF